MVGILSYGSVSAGREFWSFCVIFLDALASLRTILESMSLNFYRLLQFKADIVLDYPNCFNQYSYLVIRVIQ